MRLIEALTVTLFVIGSLYLASMTMAFVIKLIWKLMKQ